MSQPSGREKFKMVAKTMMGLEEVLAEELRECGAENIECLNRAVNFEGDMRVLYRANYVCRTALAILKPFAEFTANNDQELYDKVYQIKWEKILDVDCTFMIDSTTSGDIFTHSYYAALKTKDAIVDRFRRNFGQRPSIDTENADYKFNLHIRDNQVTLLMNSSGDSLHKRGYRQAVGIAPINEVLAAGMIKLAGWKCDCNFYDPMCGSGTMLIEAAMMAVHMAPGISREFQAEQWQNIIPKKMWYEAIEEANDLVIRECRADIQGYDMDAGVLKKARENAKRAGVLEYIHFQQRPVKELSHPKKYGFIITNPPYGERLQDKETIPLIYKSFGEQFQKLDSWSAYFISSEENAERYFGKKAAKKRKIYNGMIKAEFYQFPGPKPPARSLGEVKNEA